MPRRTATPGGAGTGDKSVETNQRSHIVLDLKEHFLIMLAAGMRHLTVNEQII